MDTSPWHAEKSFLSSGWYQNGSYAAVLPNLRRLPPKEPVPDLSSSTFKRVPPRPYSAEVCRRRTGNEIVEPLTRLLPLPPSSCRKERPQGSLETLDCHFCESDLGNEARLVEVIRHAPDLERIRLADHHWLSSDALEGLSKTRLPRLRELTLAGTYATDMTIANLVAGCPDLQILDLGGCCELTDISCVATAHELRELRLERCSNAVTAEFVGSLKALKVLEVLDLSYCATVNDKALKDLAGGCRGLRWLSLARCPSMGDEGLLAILYANPGLDHLSLALNLDTISDQALARGIRCLKRLCCLDVSGCAQIHRLVPSALAKNCEFLTDLSFASGVHLTNEELNPVFSRCSNLERLDLTCCSLITAEVFREGLMHARKLRKLVLTAVPLITDEALAQLRRDHPKITFERHYRRFNDPDDLALWRPPKKKQAAPKSKSKGKPRPKRRA
mmetsp:Transcript_23859/g.43416  ORF Transcript_23859/g.43416 Transcript_23859/m.43416 type:complete len:447 (-) Transcript_23859:71-1411(-)